MTTIKAPWQCLVTSNALGVWTRGNGNQFQRVKQFSRVVLRISYLILFWKNLPHKSSICELLPETCINTTCPDYVIINWGSRCRIYSSLSKLTPNSKGTFKSPTLSWTDDSNVLQTEQNRTECHESVDFGILASLCTLQQLG